MSLPFLIYGQLALRYDLEIELEIELFKEEASRVTFSNYVYYVRFR